MLRRIPYSARAAERAAALGQVAELALLTRAHNA